MTDIPTAFPAPTSVLEDLSKGQTTENIVQKEPPPYGSQNPTALNNNGNTGDPSTIQYQPLFRTTDYIGTTSNMHTAPSMTSQELAQIENHKGWSIFNTLCCCLCFGLIACYYSTETDKFKLRQDIQGALEASRKARKINAIASIVGMIFFIIYIVNHIRSFKARY